MNRIGRNHWMAAVLVAGAFFMPLQQYGQTPQPDSSLMEQNLRRAQSLLAASQFDSSIVCFRKALQFSRSAKDLDGELICLNGIAEGLIGKGSFEECLRVLAEGERVDSLRTKPHDLESAHTFYLLGYLDAYLNRADLSIAYSSKALEIRGRILGVDDPLTATAHYMLGLGFQKKGSYSAALECFKEALRIQIARLGDDHTDAITSMLAVGTVYSAVSNYDSALAWYNRSLPKLSAAGRSGVRLACLFYMTDAYAEKGDLQESMTLAEDALTLSRALNGEDHPTTAACYGKIGELFAASGDYDRGIELLRHSLVLSVKVHGEFHSGTAWIYRKLSRAFERQNELEKAEEYARKALEIQRRALGKDHPDVAYSLETAARIEGRRGEYRKAIGHFQEAIATRERNETGHPRIDVARLYRKLGELYTGMKLSIKALAALERSRAIQMSSSEHNPLQAGATARALGDLYAQKGELYPALRSYQEALTTLCPGYTDSSFQGNPVAEECLDPNALLESLIGKANVLRRLSSHRSERVQYLAASLSALEAAMDLAERTRKTYATEGSKLSLEENVTSVYEDGLRTCLLLYDATGEPAYKTKAFSFAEKSKANVLLDGIRDAEAKRFAGIPDSLLDRERQLRADITFCEAQLARETDNGAQGSEISRGNLDKRLFSLRQSFRALLAELEHAYPAYYAMRFKDHAATVAEVQASLEDSTCVIEYLVGKEALYIFTISKERFDILSRPKPNHLDDVTREFASSIKTIDAAGYLRAAPALYDIVVRPVADRLDGKRKLIVIPDGLLYYVPFEALLARGATVRSGKKSQVDFTSLPYLVKSHEISYSFSSTFYLNAEKRGKGAIPGIAGFAGFAPVFRDSSKSGNVIASRGAAAEEQFAPLRSITVDGKRFNELPYSAGEVQAIVSDFEKNGTKSVGYFDADASEDNFKQIVGKYTYLHIATHGFINEDQPGLSALLFSQPSTSTPGEDGILYAGEAYGLKLNADLLVLSSCESGVGKLVRGEGLMAMTRGFFYAGANNIVFSLWKVYDDATNRLMVSFYDGVIDGKPYAAALREAKLKMIANPLTAFPCKWGAFVLMGR